MNVKIRSIKDAGSLQDERLVLKVLRDMDAGELLVARTRLNTEDQVTNGISKVYWLPDKPVDAGDLIVVYTKAGIHSEKTLATGRKTHFFYWGLNAAVWSEPRTAAVVLYVDDWISQVIQS